MLNLRRSGRIRHVVFTPPWNCGAPLPQWFRIKAEFDVKSIGDHKGLLRRTISVKQGKLTDTPGPYDALVYKY
jgi:hypothetical protein